jgi:adenosine deaminase
MNDEDQRMLPKAELHVHIEGTLEPEQMFALAERNHVALEYPNVEALKAAYTFVDLQSFLNVYYAGTSVLRTEQDYEELTDAYLLRAKQQGVFHAEIFFDPQAHTQRGVSYECVLDGIWSSLSRSSEKFGITTKLILCFLRDQGAESAARTLDDALGYHPDRLVAAGLDSAERGNPPSQFGAVFDRARGAGLKTVAHAGEEGPPEYIWEALNVLKASRIDHGIRCVEDPRLVDRLRDDCIPLTVCPLSNVKLRVFDTLSDHNLKELLDAGLRVTINSDDPAYFGGYVDDNYAAVRDALHLSDDDLYAVAENSFLASFIEDHEKRRYIDLLRVR